TATNTLSGTSMATPHVTGSSALLLEANPGFTPAQIQSLIKSRGISSKISGVPSGTVNLLLNSFVGTVSFPAPASPSLLSPANANTGISLTPQLSWNAVNNASTYNVQVSTTSDFTTTVVNRTGLSGTTLSLSTLSGTTTYYWRASATNIGGNGDWSPVWSFTTLTPVKPATPVLVAPSDLATGIRIPVAFSWLSTSAVTSYKLELSTSSSFSTIAFTGNYTSTSASIGGLKKNTTYYWRVRSLDVTGTLNSDWSVGRRFTTSR
ncbi:MAG: S8 family serine peptidase, partial [Chitinophagaceae bacterium]